MTKYDMQEEMMDYYVESLTHSSVSIHGHDLNYPPHLHREAEIVTVISGEIILNVGGSRYGLQPGDSALIQPESIHGYQSCGCHCLLTIFDPALVPSMHRAMHGGTYESLVWRGVSAEYLHAANCLAELNISTDPQTLIKGYLYVMTTLLTAQLPPCQRQPAAYDGFRRILQYVNEQYDQPLTIREAARRFGVSYEHLSRLYRERTGLTFSEHVRMLRMNKAKRLLQETDMTVYDVAVRCGYSSERSFYRAFRAETGKSPRQYRSSGQQSG